MRALVETRPDRLLWAANWPHPNSPLDAKPDEADCLDALLDWVPDARVRAASLSLGSARLVAFTTPTIVKELQARPRIAAWIARKEEEDPDLKRTPDLD